MSETSPIGRARVKAVTPGQVTIVTLGGDGWRRDLESDVPAPEGRALAVGDVVNIELRRRPEGPGFAFFIVDDEPG